MLTPRLSKTRGTDTIISSFNIGLMTTKKILQPAWNGKEKIVFRFFFLYFFIQVLPLDARYLNNFFSISWLRLQYNDIFNLTRFSPRFLPGPDSFLNWVIAALIAAAGTVVWSLADKKNSEYNLLYYWLRVLLRYRLAIGIIGYGFLKFFPMQAPYPSISNLNTSYGDFTRWKLFSLSLGIVPSYESFLGLIEIVTGLLLFYRKTASIAAFVILIFTGNVFMSNLAYEGGEGVYSLYLISMAIGILAFDAQRLVKLLILQRPAAPARFKPVVTRELRYARWGIKTMVVLFFVVLYGFKTSYGYHHAPYQFPQTKGLDHAAGLYNVAVFSINRDTLPYSYTDTVRWQNIVFEKWSTISIASGRPVIIDSTNSEQVSAVPDMDKTYELQGTTGRQYYQYEADTIHQQLLLQNKNRHYPGDKWVLHYNRPDSNTIILSGTSSSHDSVYAVLNKINKKYVLKEVEKRGRIKALKL